MSEDKDFVRMNVRLSKDMHDWLVEKSNKLGVPKSSLIVFALETYIKQDDAVASVPDILKMLEQAKGL